MPIYEYRCNACGHKLESLQRLSDAPLVTCPACGKDALAKQLSAAGFQLKGSGWYATDFKNSGKPAAKSSEKSSDKKGDSGSADGKGGESKGDGEKKAAPSCGAGGCAACS